MRLRKRGGSGVAEGDLTPMIDMTFQLIAFFMVLVNFSETEADARVVLPESELAKPPEKAPDEFLTVQMTKDGDCIVDGRVLSVATVEESLRRKATYYESTGRVVGDVVVIVRAHLGAPTGKVQELIKQCQIARFEKFVLRAKEKPKY
ncbi:MAG: biopolymer transporter ExbD [Planctomycetales bacterium]|nr:biopolymer transporter ExbD [Planctomycetales bacterium]